MGQAKRRRDLGLMPPKTSKPENKARLKLLSETSGWQQAFRRLSSVGTVTRLRDESAVSWANAIQLGKQQAATQDESRPIIDEDMEMMEDEEVQR